MCFFGGGDDDPRLSGVDNDLREFINANGGLDAFGGSVAKARKEFEIGPGAGTDRAGVPGPTADAPTFLGARIETDRTGAGSLKTLPERNDPNDISTISPSSDEGGIKDTVRDAMGTPEFDIPNFPTLPRLPHRGGGGGRRQPFSPIPTIEAR